MKQFIICPECGSVELAEARETFPFYSFVHNCSKCDYTIMESEWKFAKAISIKQPWGYLICANIKDIENRTWRTNFRGRVLIHCGAKIDGRNNEVYGLFNDEQWDYMGEQSRVEMILNQFPISCIFGSVEIVDCVQNSTSLWAEKGCWHWVLKNPVMFYNPILNVKGKLSFFIPNIKS